jgi:hypothetical protein
MVANGLYFSVNNYGAHLIGAHVQSVTFADKQGG